MSQDQHPNLALTYKAVLLLALSVCMMLFVAYMVQGDKREDNVEQKNENVSLDKKEEVTFGTGGLVELHNPEGVIFPLSAYASNMTIDNTIQAWDPTVEDIEKAEEILMQSTSAQYPNIYAKLARYKRQYVGIIDQKGDRSVTIYAFITSGDDLSWKKGPILIIGGGDGVFSTAVNLDEETCTGLTINDLE